MLPHAVDFETEAIQPRPDYPPMPVGVAIAHGRNVSYDRDALAYRTAMHWGNPLFHNASFDIAVAMEELGLEFPRRFEDTLYLLALLFPYAPTLSLKPSLERVLGREPVEQNDLRAWILENVPGASTKNWGAHIARAPFALVSPYAKQDARGTLDLFKNLMPKVKALGMTEAYEREKALLPMLLENERRGIRVNLAALKRDTDHFQTVLADTDAKLRAGFRMKNLDLDSNDELADAIEKLGIELPLTDKGNRRTDKGTLSAAELPPKLKALLLYRSKLAQDLRTFMQPWLHVAKRTGGVIHTHWNQVRGASHANKKGGGARTGRISSEPNFQNITTPEKAAEVIAKLQLLDPKSKWELPTIRRYIVPFEKGWVLYSRDFNQQEVRLLANFEEGPLQKLYQQHPNVDVHSAVQQLIRETTGLKIERKPVKILNFLNIYGGGVDAFMAQSGLDRVAAETVRDAYFRALPSIKTLMRDVQREPMIRTLGGRVYEPEPARLGKDGNMRRFEYKLLNYLIQGSAADQTKEVMVQCWQQMCSESNMFYMQVHDELVFSCPRADAQQHLDHLGALMVETFKDRLSVPFLSDPEIGLNWEDMKSCQ